MQELICIEVLRLTLGSIQSVQSNLSQKDWCDLHDFAVRQCIVGLLYKKVADLPENQRPSKELLLRWCYEFEAVAGISKKMDDVAANLTQLFTDNGCRSVILKGQANASLYPEPLSRQSGDIDIWVEGGKSKILEILSQLGIVGHCKIGLHDVSVQRSVFGCVVEVHFVPCSGNRGPVSNKRLQDYLNRELKHPFEKVTVPATGFFCVPSTCFSLVMQLAHIQRHFLTLGIGVRQFIDYFYLLKSSSKEDRENVAKKLKYLNLEQIAAALMWVQKEIFLMEDSYLLCKPDAKYGKVLWKDALEGGDFARYSKRTRGLVLVWWLRNKIRLIGLLRFNFYEVFWQFMHYGSDLLFKLPSQIRLMVKLQEKKKH
ncbi:nucleotidyltransferase family protein [Candidatus Saccharibacteria bacterium]|nr:nucleotidyltransferase family protein [Candidatus Saccharibacteria bacterium]